IDVAVLLKIEVRGRRFRILEDEARRLVDRHRARAGVRIRTLSRMDLTSVEAKPARLFHGASSVLGSKSAGWGDDRASGAIACRRGARWTASPDPYGPPPGLYDFAGDL